MNIKRIQHILNQGEGIRVEFKESKKKLPRNLFESVCAMLNREGGDILLGVDDNSGIVGIEASHINAVKTDLVNLSNNPQKLSPPFILFPSEYEIDGKIVIHIPVPASSQVHKTGGFVFDRSNDGDFKVNEPYGIANIYNQKRTHYTEGIIYPAIRFEDFNQSLFPKIRNLIKSNEADHPWLALSDEQLLKKAGLWKRDFQTGQEGYTLAAVMLLGEDEVIQQIVPHYKIDALVRIKNKDRYDDRLYIKTNLIDAYEQLMNFVAKHLPDNFYLERDQRKSLRTTIFREVVANLIVHREYTNAHPATFVIHNDRVVVENANNPNGSGLIIANDFSPFPKNPLIAKFFIQLGRVDELGSGLINVHKYIKDYTPNGIPQFIEGNTFKTIIPMVASGSDGATDGAIEGALDGAIDGVTTAVKEKLALVLSVIAQDEGKKAPEYAEITKIAQSTLERYIKQLRTINFIVYKGKAAQTGGYYLTEELKNLLSKIG